MTQKTARKSTMLGEAGYSRIANDSYETESRVTQAMLGVSSFRGKVWEPACGSGKMARVLLAGGYDVVSSDLHDYGFAESGKNFLDQIELPGGVESIVTNPPYSDDLVERFIVHAMQLTMPVKGMVAMLLRNEYDCADGRRGLFNHPAFHVKIVLTFRPRWVAEQKASPRFQYSWFIWDWQRPADKAAAVIYVGDPTKAK